MQKKNHSIMNLILNKPSLFIITMLFDFFSALFSTISSVRLAIFTQNVIEGKYIEAIQVELVNLILILVAVLRIICIMYFKIKQFRVECWYIEI